jgi:hypothetical protein
VARPEPAALARLRACARPGAQLRIVFGYGPAEAAAVQDLPGLAEPGRLAALVGAYRDAGFRVRARPLAREQVGELGTTWAGKLAFSGGDRQFVELLGAVES